MPIRKKISANDKRIKEYERKDFTVKTKQCPTIGQSYTYQVL